MTASLTQLRAPTIEDIAETLAILVTPEQIDMGIRENGLACPVALALRDAGHHWVEVGLFSIRADGHLYAITSDLAQWIDSFDNGGDVAPERFVVRRVK